MKTLLKLAILLIIPLIACSSALTEEVFIEVMYEYKLADAGVIITGFLLDENTPDRLVIPAELCGEPVTGIAEGAFTFYWGELSFAAEIPGMTYQDGFLIDAMTNTLLYTAPSSQGKPLPPVRRLAAGCTTNWVTGWGEMAVIIPEGVEEIAAYTFYDWEAKSLTLPESLRLIETCAFEAFSVAELPIVIPASVQEVQYGAFGLAYQVGEWGLYESPDMIVELGESTHYETYEEYLARTGDDSWEIN